MGANIALLEARSLRKRYSGVVAVDDVSIEVGRGALLSVVGESGSGKSTLLRCLAALEAPDAGEVFFEGNPLRDLRGNAERHFRRNVQLVMQDASMSMNPQWEALEIVREPLDILRRDLPRRERNRLAQDSMLQVELDLSLLRRRPLELSGGQRQRLQLARAMTLRPTLLLLDEPLAGLDAPIQAEVLKLIQKLRCEQSLTCVLVTHDLEAAWSVSTEVAILWRGNLLGRFVPEPYGSVRGDYRPPEGLTHPYALALFERLRQRGTLSPGTSPISKPESESPR